MGFQLSLAEVKKGLIGLFVPYTGATGDITTTHDIILSSETANRVAIFDGSKKIKSSTTTTTQLGYLDATSSIQTQLNTKALTTLVGSPCEIQLAASDETTALTTGTAKVTFRMPYAMTLTSARGSLTTAQASGSIFTVNIKESGTTIFSTKLTIDNTELTSTTAATPAVISDNALADDASMTVDIDQVGNGSATGLKITLIGTRA